VASLVFDDFWQAVCYAQWRIYRGVWQAWFVPWAPLWWGCKCCFAKIKICDLRFLQPLLCAPYND